MIRTKLKQYDHFPFILLHIFCWGLFFAFPFLLMERTEMPFNWSHYLRHSMVPATYMVVFYFNYFVLIPHYLFRQQSGRYILYNVVFLFVMALFLHLWLEMSAPDVSSMPHFRKGPPRPPKWTFMVRDMLGMAFAVGVSAIIRITGRWRKIEEARLEAEKSRTEAELKNLRNQLNPHFLLNTLNNIYALTAFDTTKAQQAIQELSKLLRYMLYDNQQNYVPLHKEADFIHNYIELMRIRLATNVTLETNINIPANTSIQIAPLIFISLIENAFKHGISSQAPSYIKIHLSENEGVITCEIRNSNFPKTTTDKSGSGIGLKQVSKRLNLIYPDNYMWDKGVSDDEKEYYSLLIIKIKSQEQ